MSSIFSKNKISTLANLMAVALAIYIPTCAAGDLVANKAETKETQPVGAIGAVEGEKSGGSASETAISVADNAAGFETIESRSKRAARINHNILIISVTILSFFVACRLFLIWQITKARKKLPREQNAFEH